MDAQDLEQKITVFFTRKRDELYVKGRYSAADEIMGMLEELEKAIDYKFLQRHDDDMYNQGHADGQDEADDDAYNEGYDVGYEEGTDEGFEKGRSEGYSEGYEEGYSEGYEAALDHND